MTKMKNLLLVMLVLALGAVTACGGSDGATTESTQQVKTTQLSKAWDITSYTASGDAVTVDGATITFTSNNSFTVAETTTTTLPAPAGVEGSFPTSGTWKFANTNFNAITLTPGNVTLTILDLKDNALKFEYTGQTAKDATGPVVVTAVPAL